MTKIVIRSLEATAGYLGDAGKISFEPGLNVILGPKGSYKSTIVELLRVVLGVDEERIAEHLAPDGRITIALGDGEIRCELDVDGSRVTATRKVDGGVKLSRKVPLDGVEIFSQGAIKELSSEDRRLELVDQAHRAKRASLLEKRDERAARAAVLGQKLMPVLRQLREKDEDVRAGADAREKLEKLLADPTRPKGPANLERERKAHEERDALLAKTRELLAVRQDLLSTLHDLCERGRNFAPTAASLAAYAKEHGEAAGAAQEVAGLLQRAADTFARAESWCDKEPPADLALRKLEAHLAEQDRPYERLLEQEKAHRTIVQEETVQRGVVAKADRAKADVTALQKSETRIRAEREKLYVDMDGIDKELTALRQKRVRELGKISEHTAVELHVGALTASYEKALEGLLPGLPSLRSSVVAHFKPRELLRVIEQRDAAALVKAVRARSNEAQRFIERLETSTELHARLERVTLQDEVHITFRDRGGETLVEHLSEGQKATTLLPLLLQADRPATVVVDEPENHLDNRFVAETLVPQLQALKKSRQVIVVTHNANLATLAEPDHLIVMDVAGKDRAAKPLVGPFETLRQEVVRIAEGGARAFRQREEKYEIPSLKELGDEGPAKRGT